MSTVTLTRRVKRLYVIFACCLFILSICFVTIFYQRETKYLSQYVIVNNNSCFDSSSSSQLHSYTQILSKGTTNETEIMDISTTLTDDRVPPGVTVKPDILEELQALLKCNDKTPKVDVHQQQAFWVLGNYVMADRSPKCHETITLTTQGDFTFLDNLIMLLKKWQGPISVALYTPGEDFQATLDSIAYLRNCRNDTLVKELVTFHLVYDYKHQPKLLNGTIKNAFVDTWENCSIVPYEVEHRDIYKEKHNLTYPINILRNLARRTAMTHFVLPVDIELYPSTNFIEKFLEMIAKHPNLINDSAKVFVLPLFEISADQVVPQTKRELQKMIEVKEAFLFHVKLCKVCHLFPKFDDWVQKLENDTLDVFTSTKRLGPYKEWEPFYVGTNSDPWFDERLTWEGQQNKMVQGLIMCLMDYDYMILDNAFLVHKSGIKKSKEQMKKYKKIVSATRGSIKREITPELSNIYGRRDGCQYISSPQKKM